MTACRNRSQTDSESSIESGRTIHDLIVVGGGMAGLTASAYAVRAGCRVLLLDKESVLGGLIRSFERGGFTWDAGIRALEDSGIIFPMLESLGIEIEFVKSPVSLGIEDRVIPVESPANLVDYRTLLEHFYPESREDIARILAAIRQVMKQMDVLYGIENPLFKDLRHDRRYLFDKLLPWLGKFLLTIGKINRMDMPVDEHLESLSDSRALIDIISQHFFQKTPAFFALSYFSLYLDYVYPVGGTGALPRAMEAYCIERGVDIRKQTRITAVDPVGHTATDQQGTVHAYRKLVWAADLKTFYRMIDLDALPAGSLQRRARERAELVNASGGGDSVFTLYLAVEIEPAWFAAKSNGHFFYTPSRDGVGRGIHSELAAMLSKTASDGDHGVRERAEQWIERYIHSTTYEISIPVLKDASLAPAGKTGLIVSVLFDHALCAAAREQGWYEELKSFTEDRLIERLDSTIYPGLRRAIQDRFSSTPLSIASTVGSADGAITGWSFTNPTMPAVHRMQHVAKSVVTPFPDIVQAGQWSYSPSGLPIAILTGKLAADRVTKGLRGLSTPPGKPSARSTRPRGDHDETDTAENEGTNERRSDL
jgi:phytoene dehydrogenase-like protein